jgi:hypothetical protein
MGLLIAQSGGPVNLDVGQAQIDITAISKIDGGVGFEEAATVDVEGVTCIPVTYTQNETGPTPDRLNDLVNEVSFTSPPEIVVFAVSNPDAFTLSDGTELLGNGFAFPVGSTDSPFANNVCTLYDTTLCDEDGIWVDKEGGGETCMTTSVLLYHELSHCFHYVTGTTAAGAQEEVNAEIDENDMRDVRGLDHRDVNSHNGGCGHGCGKNCCIVASLSTGSAFSEEIKQFRRLREHTLRHSAVGGEFFKEFFYRYYGFSPEVTRLLGSKPHLSPLIRERFVLPLLAGVEMLIFYADNKGTEMAKFLRGQSKREGLTELYENKFLDELSTYIVSARNFDGKAISVVLKNKGKKYVGFRKLLRHINKETINDEYIDWSLVAVVELWVQSAKLLHSGKPEAKIDFEVYEKIVHWIALMPVSGVWEDFSRLQTELELLSIEQFIFDPRSKEIFSARLIEEHPRYTTTIRRWAEGKGGMYA